MQTLGEQLASLYEGVPPAGWVLGHPEHPGPWNQDCDDDPDGHDTPDTPGRHDPEAMPGAA